MSRNTLRLASRIARLVFEEELRLNGTAFERRKRLVSQPPRTSDDTGEVNQIEQAYGRKDPVNQAEPLDWNDTSIFSPEGTVHIWISSKSRNVNMYQFLQSITGRVEARAALGSVEEGDVLVSEGAYWEVLVVNTPSLAACSEIEIIKRG